MEIQLVPGATHLFEEPRALEQVAELAARWFLTHPPAAEGFPGGRAGGPDTEAQPPRTP